MSEAAYTYEFRCPKCRGSWKFEEFATIAKDVFSSFSGSGVCPLCGTTFSWLRPGKMIETAGAPWYDGKPHYKPHPCTWCGRMIDGKRQFCNTQCNKKWYYRQTHPVVKRKTLIISPPAENNQ